jgi:hypothetical protein
MAHIFKVAMVVFGACARRDAYRAQGRTAREVGGAQPAAD